MKLAIIVTHYIPHIGGLELATYHLASELSKQNNDVNIITPYPDNKDDNANTDFRIHRYPINAYPDEPKLRSFVDGLIFFRKAVQTIKEIKPDIIHSQNITNSIPAYMSWKKYHIPYIICIHGNLELMGPFLPKLLRHFWAKLPYIKSAAGIVTLTSEMGMRVENELGRKPFVIPNGVDLERFFPNDENNSNIDGQTIVTLSRIDDKKGLEYAIMSMTQILDVYPQAKFKIVGDGNHRSVLEKLSDEIGVANSVEFVGSVPNMDVPNHLRDADVFLLPSLFEGLPLTLLESMACGLPIISTPVSIAPDVIEKWNNGILIPFKSSNAIANAVIKLLSDPELRRRYAKNSVVAAKDTMSWESVAEQYLKMYGSCIDSNKV